MTLPDNVLPKGFWNFSLGNVVTVLVFVAGMIYAVGAFASKSNTQGEADKVLAQALKQRIELIDAKASITDSRLTGLETSIVYIRESLTRIERAVAPK